MWQALRFSSILSLKILLRRWSVMDWWPKIYYLQLFRPSKGTLSRWSRSHLQSLASTNPHWARVVGYGPFSLCVIPKEDLCPSIGDINRLMMIMINILTTYLLTCNNIIYMSLIFCPWRKDRGSLFWGMQEWYCICEY
jgi:hypothetical protein